MESDENAPPPKTEQPTRGGLLSPFGLLAGVRAMLSPVVKDQSSQESESPVTSRPVLKDMNISGSPKVKILTNGQGGTAGPGDKAQEVVPPAGEVLAHLSPGWSERGEGTSSVASDYSFASALSPDPNTLQDGFQFSPSKLNGVESDTDTSTAYESAGETEGNLSSVDDVASSEILLNYPIAVSSPFTLDHEIDVVDQSEESDCKSFVSQDLIERDRGNLSVSCLVDPFGSLSLSTPLKQKSTPGKAHVTLDSDVSGDIVESPGPDEDLNINAEVKASLETTITLSDVSDSEVAPERKENPTIYFETVDISADISTGTLSVEEVEVIQESESNVTSIPETSASELKPLEELSQTFNVSCLDQSELSLTEATLLEGFDQSYHYSQEASNTSDVHGDEDNAVLDETVVEVVQESEPEVNEVLRPDLLGEVAANSSEPSSSESFVKSEGLSSTNSESSEESPTIQETRQIEDPQKLGANNAVIHSGELASKENFEVAPVSALAGCECSPCTPEDKSKSGFVPPEGQVNFKPIAFEKNLEADPCVTHPESESETCILVKDAKQHRVGAGNQDITDVSENSETANCKEAAPNTLPSSFEDEPLPVKVPRTFQEILAEKLAAEEQVVASSQKFEDVPIPVKVPRTFDEILAEQLREEEQASALSAPPQVCSESIPQCTNTLEKLAIATTANEVVNDDVEPTESLSVSPLTGSLSGTAVETAEACSSAEVLSIQEAVVEKCPVQESPLKKSPFNKSPPQTLLDPNSPLIKSKECHEDEVPILPKAHRTFEEILAAELAAQSDPELAVPSFSGLQAKGFCSSNLNESLADIITSSQAQTSSLEFECEPDLVGDTISAEFEPDTNGGLNSLIEKCKRQEQDLEQSDTDFNCVTAEATRLSLSCLDETLRSDSNLSQCSDSSCATNKTVIMADSSNVDPFLSKSKVGISPQTTREQISYGDEVTNDSLAQGLNLEEEEFQSGDAFKDPSAFDFLILHGNTRSARDLRKESLYVKFDPLVGALSDSFATTMHPENSSDSQANASGVVEGQQSSETKLNTTENLLSLSPSSSKNQAHDSTPAAPTTPVRKNVAKTTPIKTPAHVLLNETLESIGSRVTPVKQEELIKKLQEHQSVLEEQDKAYQERIAELEQRLQEMDLESAEQLKEKDKQLQEKVKSLSELNVIMKEYEKTISRLVAEKSQEKAALEGKYEDLIKDRDQAQQHLNNMEIAFADIHTKYERLKSVMEAFKKNEDTLNTALAEKEANIAKVQNMYDMLKSHAVSKLEKANQDLETIKQKHQQENAKLKAMLKKLEIKTKSLEEALEQKSKENQALTAICDELINKVGE